MFRTKRFAVLLLLALALLALASHGQAIRPGEVFEMRLSGMPPELAQEMAQQYTVADDGTVKLPYIGAIRAGGVTPAQFSTAVEQKLMAGKIFTSPTVLINLQVSSRMVTVGGLVRNPQTLQWSSDLTLSAAINRAGGLGEFGDGHHVRIIRDGSLSVYDYLRRDRNARQNPRLLPGDEIEVP